MKHEPIRQWEPSVSVPRIKRRVVELPESGIDVHSVDANALLFDYRQMQEIVAPAADTISNKEPLVSERNDKTKQSIKTIIRRQPKKSFLRRGVGLAMLPVTLPFKAIPVLKSRWAMVPAMLGGALAMSPLMDPVQNEVQANVKCELTLQNGKQGAADFAGRYDAVKKEFIIDKNTTDMEFYKGVKRPDDAAQKCLTYLNNDVRYNFSNAVLSYGDGSLYAYEVRASSREYRYDNVVDGMKDLKTFIQNDYEDQTGDYKSWWITRSIKGLFNGSSTIKPAMVQSLWSGFVATPPKGNTP